MKPYCWRLRLVACLLASVPLGGEAAGTSGQALSQQEQRFQTALGIKALRLSSALLALDGHSALAWNQCAAQPARTRHTAPQEHPAEGGRMPARLAHVPDGQVRYRQNDVGKARWDYGVARARIRVARGAAMTACRRLPAGEQEQCKRAVALRTARDEAEAEAAFFSATAQAKALDGR